MLIWIGMYLFDYVCIHCGEEEEKPFTREGQGDRVKLVRCCHCENITDPYIEANGTIVALDCILLKLPAWRHSLINAPSLKNTKKKWLQAFLVLVFLIFLEFCGRLVVIGGLPLNIDTSHADATFGWSSFQFIVSDFFLRSHGILLSELKLNPTVEPCNIHVNHISHGSIMHELWIGSLWDSELALDVEGPCARSFSCMGSGAFDTYSTDLLAAANSFKNITLHYSHTLSSSTMSLESKIQNSQKIIGLSSKAGEFRTPIPGSCRRILESKLPTLPIIRFASIASNLQMHVPIRILKLILLVASQIVSFLICIQTFVASATLKNLFPSFVWALSRASIARMVVLFVPAVWPMPPVLSLFLSFFIFSIHFFMSLQAMYRFKCSQAIMVVLSCVGAAILSSFLF